LRLLKIKIILILLALAVAFPGISCAQEGFESAEILFTRGIVAYDGERYEEALRDLLKAHELDPRHIDVVYYLGLTYSAQKNYAQAALYLRKGLEIAPKNHDIRYQLGLALYGQNRSDEALREFLVLYEANPQMDNLGYFIGLCYFQKKDYENAATYFRRNVSTEISSRQLNLYYLGLALQTLGKEAEAIEELTEAIKTAPASPLVVTVQKLLTTLRERTSEKPFRIEVTLNAQYSSNTAKCHAGKGSCGEWLYMKTDSTYVIAGGLPPGTRSYGNLLHIKADYTLYRSGPWESTVTYSFLQTLNYHAHDFDLEDHLIAANLSYRYLLPGGMYSYTGVQVSNDIVLEGGKKFVQRPTGTFSFTVLENPSNITMIFSRLHYKDFFEKPTTSDEHRDGLNKSVGLIHYIRFAGGQHQINFGYYYDHENTQGKNWRYSGHTGLAGLLIGLPWGLRATANFEFHASSYPGQNSIYSEHRRDGQTTVSGALARDIAPNLTVKLQHLWSKNDSTIDGFRTVGNHIYALGMTWRY